MQTPPLLPVKHLSELDGQRYAELESACQAWIDRGDETFLARWLRRELDHDGSPRTLPVEEWGRCAEVIDRGRRERDGLSLAILDQINGLSAWVVHTSRPDGSTVFGSRGKQKTRIARLLDLAASAKDPALASVVGRWFPGVSSAKGPPVPPPLPAICDDDRVLAMLRPDWTSDGDWIAVDHRDRGVASRIELAGAGRPWLLGDWKSDRSLDTERITCPVPSAWSTGAHADCLEWTFRAGLTRITRTAVLLRYRKLAIIGQYQEGPTPTSEFRVPLAEGVSAVGTADIRTLALTRARASARLIPLALPSSPRPTDRGSLALEGNEVVLSQTSTARRRWLPLVLAWGKAPTAWRTLTVTESSKICTPDVAFAARLSWGVGVDGLLIYRSLGRPALRAVLGLQTRARFLIGRFTPEGDVVPLLSLD
jgi:hypothetical protein